MPAARTFRIAGAMVSAVVLAGLAPAAAGAATPPPDVTSFTSSPTSLTPAAATVHLHVSITHATTCTFKSSPAITGSTAPFTCTSGSINRTAKVPANTGSTTRKYVFSINASGPGGTAGATLTMYQFPPTPTVDNYQASPSTLSYQGGTTTVSATFTRATTCKFTSSPAVSGSTASFPCGTSFSRDITIPENDGSTRQDYQFTLQATGPGGVTTATLLVYEYPAAPSVANYVSNPKTIAAAGHTLKFTATVARANTCTLTISPAISPAPQPVDCSAGSYSQSVKVPANTGSSSISYHFKLTREG